MEIAEKKLTKKQRKQCLDQAKKELDQVIIGENISLDQVTKPLFLPEYLQDGAVEVSYSFSDYEVFRPDGSLEQEPKEPVLAEITAELSCQEESCLYQFYVRAVPREKSAQELFEEKLKALIEKENQRESATFVELFYGKRKIKNARRRNAKSRCCLIMPGLWGSCLCCWEQE